ncbi:DUF202 domain-containing protein [Rhodococcus erythropolis]|uniref:DUF202 domain-containing protein n=1 Tax=Rhodococcus erythropolis TaxID=1833 RepID=UPI003AF3AFD4
MNGVTARDRGLQLERTALSWRRTALASTSIAALFIHQAAKEGWEASAIVPLLATFTLLGTACAAFIRDRTLRSGCVRLSRSTAFAVSCATAATAVGTAVIRVTDTGSQL